MFERLLAMIPSSPVVAPADAGSPPPGRRGTLGGLAGTTLGQGLYRFHTRSSAAAADALVEAAYPEFTGRVACFGMDWLGRQFSPDPARCVGYKVPLFLGGADDIGDLELADLDVYWTITGQLRTAAIG